MGLELRVTAMIAAAVLLGACGGGGGTDAGDEADEGGVTVVAQDFAFDPATIEAASGDTVSVTLQNEDDVEHSVTIEELDFDVEAEGGESATGEFTAGEESVEFFCRYHPDQMRGEISIGGSGGAEPGGESEERPEDDGGSFDY